MIMCEYAHAMGNSLGNFDEFWATIRAHDCLRVSKSFDAKVWDIHGSNLKIRQQWLKC